VSSIGTRLPRKEDPRLLRGRGRFGDDISVPGQLWARVVRSPSAHGDLNDVDVTLVEGAVSSQDDLNRIQKIRQRTNILISLGDCAVTGNVPAMRNSIPVQKLLQKIYIDGAQEGKVIPSDRVPALLKQARPLREFVKVDLCLPGCPPPSKAIVGVINDLLDGKKPDATLKVKFG